jgi:hypothetical protein
MRADMKSRFRAGAKVCSGAIMVLLVIAPAASIGGICTRRLRAMSGHCSSAITVDANAFAGSSLQVGSRLIRSIARRYFSMR